MRLTENLLQQLLAQNEGFEATTHFRGKNFRETRKYTISDGQLAFRSTGKTSWADGRFDKQHLADPEQTRRFVRKFMDSLNTDGLA